MGPRALSRMEDWQRVRSRGRSGRSGGLRVKVVARPDPEAPSRLGLRVRASGPARAVTRNRARRRLREAWRLSAPEKGLDVVIHADGTYADKNYQAVVEELRRALDQAGVTIR